jgi:2-methylaconitate cis-trans-isomerase PrpF
MGLGDVGEKVMPKIALVSRSTRRPGIRSRYFVPRSCHAAHAVTGAIAVACCALIEGSVADDVAHLGHRRNESVSVEHPSGYLTIDLETEGSGSAMEIRRAALIRTARPLLRGEVFIPRSVWTPRSNQPVAIMASHE